MPLAEHDCRGRPRGRCRSSFNSRAPRGARRPLGWCNHLRSKFQFTCPSRSTTEKRYRINSTVKVSIHVPLAEHDLLHPVQLSSPGGFNSRAPRGARQAACLQDVSKHMFQFTCPSRSTTPYRQCLAQHDSKFQFTCPSRSTTSDSQIHEGITWVSIHVPLAEHDCRG